MTLNVALQVHVVAVQSCIMISVQKEAQLMLTWRMTPGKLDALILVALQSSAGIMSISKYIYCICLESSFAQSLSQSIHVQRSIKVAMQCSGACCLN